MLANLRKRPERRRNFGGADVGGETRITNMPDVQTIAPPPRLRWCCGCSEPTGITATLAPCGRKQEGLGEGDVQRCLDQPSRTVAFLERPRMGMAPYAQAPSSSATKPIDVAELVESAAAGAAISAAAAQPSTFAGHMLNMASEPSGNGPAQLVHTQ